MRRSIILILLLYFLVLVYGVDDQPLYHENVENIQQSADGSDFSPGKRAEMGALGALGAPSFDRQNLTARIAAFATQCFEGRRNHELCDQYLLRSEHCGDYSPNQYLDPCYCVEKTIGDETHHCCDYRGQNIEASVVLSADHIDLSDADFLQLSINVNTINRLSISNISNSVFNSVTDLERSDMEFRVENSTVSKIPMIKSLTVTESTIKSLGNLQVANIFSRNSHIYEMKDLKFILEEKLDQESYSKVCFNVVGSKIDSLSNVQIMCNAYLSNTQIGLIKNTETNSIVISNSSIDVIYPYGLQFLSGSAVIENVIIQHLHREAIVIPLGSDLTLVNVTVVHCDEPCFLFDIGSVRDVTNVSLSGRIISNALDKALLGGLRERYTEDVCKYNKSLNRLICNLKKLERNHIELNLQRKQNLTEMVIAKHKNVDIIEGCYTRITLIEIKGYYHRSSLSHQHEGFDQTENCNFSTLLTLKKSALKTIFSRRLKGLRFLDSYIGNLDVDETKYFLGKRSTIKRIEKLTFKAEKRNLTMDKMSIGTVKNLELHSPANIINSNIDQIENLVFDHIGLSSTIKDTKINRLIEKGIAIKSGVLELDNVPINQISEGAIDISLDGKLILRNMEAVKWTDCAEFPPIRAVSRTQIVYMDSPNPASLQRCVTYSGDENYRAPFFPSDDIGLLAPLTEIKYQMECAESNKRHLLCDMRKSRLLNTTTYLLRDYFKLNHFDEIKLHNAHDLVIGEHCFSKIHVFDVNIRFMETVANSCYYSLQAFASSISKITNRVWNLDIQHCEVVELYPSAVVNRIFIARSEIQNLNVIVQRGTFANSTVKNIDKLRVRGDLTITECELENAATESIVVEKNGTLVIANSTIQILDTASITVFGTLVLHNVTVYRAMDESIRLGSSSNISMRNVTFIDATLRVMSLLESANVSAERVVIDGKDATVTHKFPLFSGNLRPPLESVDQFGRPLVREDECLNIVRSRSKRSKPVKGESEPVEPPQDIHLPDYNADNAYTDDDDDSGHVLDSEYYQSDDYDGDYSSDFNIGEPNSERTTESSAEHSTDETTSEESSPIDYSDGHSIDHPSNELAYEYFHMFFSTSEHEAIFLIIVVVTFAVVIVIGIVFIVRFWFYNCYLCSSGSTNSTSANSIIFHHNESNMMAVIRTNRVNRLREPGNEVRETNFSREETRVNPITESEYSQVERLRQTGPIQKRVKTTTSQRQDFSPEYSHHTYERVRQQDPDETCREPLKSDVGPAAFTSQPPSRASRNERSFATLPEDNTTGAIARNLIISNTTAGSSFGRAKSLVPLRAPLPVPGPPVGQWVSRDDFLMPAAGRGERIYQNFSSPPS